jgi:hypothetical protein
VAVVVISFSILHSYNTGRCEWSYYFVIFVIDAPGAVLSNNTSELLPRVVNRISPLLRHGGRQRRREAAAVEE